MQPVAGHVLDEDHLRHRLPGRASADLVRPFRRILVGGQYAGADLQREQQRDPRRDPRPARQRAALRAGAACRRARPAARTTAAGTAACASAPGRTPAAAARSTTRAATTAHRPRAAHGVAPPGADVRRQTFAPSATTSASTATCRAAASARRSRASRTTRRGAPNSLVVTRLTTSSPRKYSNSPGLQWITARYHGSASNANNNARPTEHARCACSPGHQPVERRPARAAAATPAGPWSGTPARSPTHIVAIQPARRSRITEARLDERRASRTPRTRSGRNRS